MDLVFVTAEANLFVDQKQPKKRKHKVVRLHTLLTRETNQNAPFLQALEQHDGAMLQRTL